MKCPFCNADLAENSRFCLYCMKSLNEKEIIEEKKRKNKWWLITFTAILLLLLIGFGVWFGLGKSASSEPANNDNPQITQSDNLSNEEAYFDKNENNTSSSEDSQTEKEEPSTDKNSVIVNVEEEGTTQSEETTKSSSENIDETTTTTASYTKESTTTTTTTTTTTAPSVENETIENVTWYYRAAYSSDYDKRYNKVETADAITIIGFANIPSNGIFKVPETIDGKTVVAINMSNPQGYTFNDSAVKNKVKKVYLPHALNKIANGTFSECVNLTDLYVAGEYLYADPSVFPSKSTRTGTLTIHTSDSSWCLYGSKYFDVYCSPYGANEYYAAWTEWNGDIYN